MGGDRCGEVVRGHGDSPRGAPFLSFFRFFFSVDFLASQKPAFSGFFGVFVTFWAHFGRLWSHFESIFVKAIIGNTLLDLHHIVYSNHATIGWYATLYKRMS